MGRVPRLAWFTPLPPVRSGIAAYSTELLPLLAADYDIDVFAEPAGIAPTCRLPASASSVGFHVFGAHDFLWKHDRAPYDLIVYQLGNAACHDFMWPHLPRFPGLVVLHDGQLHHERSRALLSRKRVEDYRAEFRYNHPDAPPHLPDLIESTLGGSLYYLYPMLRWVVRTARLVAVHSEGLSRAIREAHPGVEVRLVAHGMIDPMTPAAAAAAPEMRRRHGLPADALVFAAFGLVTPEKRISAALRGLARTVAAGTDAYLLLAGGIAAYYDAAAEARMLGVAERVKIAGYVPDEELPGLVAAADVCMCLRWPTSRETSGTWIRAVAAGRPTIITDLAHTTDVPALEPRSWQPTGCHRSPSTGLDRPTPVSSDPGESLSFTPISVAVDLLDEDNCVAQAMTRLATDATLREQLGRNARAYWQAHHTMAHAVDDYRAAIRHALERPAPRVRDLPAHLLADHTGLARDILARGGVRTDILF